MSWVLWAVAAAGVVHVIEEFGWPGGFLQQIRRVAPRLASAATPRFAAVVNGLMLSLCGMAALRGRRSPVFALSAAALALVNGLVHVGASVRARRYVPGLVSGALAYLPLGLAAYASFARAGLLSARTLLASVLLGLAWQLVPLGWLGLAGGRVPPRRSRALPHHATTTRMAASQLLDPAGRNTETPSGVGDRGSGVAGGRQGL